MLSFAHKDKYLTLKSFLLSLLLHSIIIYTFIFVFSVRPQEHKPKFIFLGSILQRQDILNFSGDRVNNKDIDSRKLGKVSIDVQTNWKFARNGNPFTIVSVEKPFILTSMKSQDKTTVKSTFDILNQDVHNKKGDSNDINFKIFPYKPLKIDQR